MNIPNNERRCGSLVPTLTLSSTRFCPGGPWTLAATNGVPNTTVHLLGTGKGTSWKTADWGRTDGNGNLNVPGSFAAGSEGDYTLRLDIGGLLSNTVSFEESRCTS